MTSETAEADTLEWVVVCQEELAHSRERASQGVNLAAPPPKALGTATAFATKTFRKRPSLVPEEFDGHAELQAATSEFVDAVLEKKPSVHRSLLGLADLVRESFPPPSPCALTPAVLEVCAVYLEQWALEVTTESIVDEGGRVRSGAVAWGLGWSTMLEYVSRAEPDKLSRSRAHALASAAANVMHTGLNNLRSYSQELARNRAEICSEGSGAAAVKALSDWFVLVLSLAPNCLVALQNIQSSASGGVNDIRSAIETIRTLASLDQPFGNDPDNIRTMELALSIAEECPTAVGYRSAAADVVDAEFGRQCLVLMSITGLMSWEEGHAGNPGYGDEVPFRPAKLKRRALQLCGHVAAVDVNFAVAVTDKSNYVARIAEALTLYEARGLESVLKELVHGVASFAWEACSSVTPGVGSLTRRRSSSLRRSKSSEKHVIASPNADESARLCAEAGSKLLSTTFKSMGRQSSFLQLVHALEDLVSTGDAQATRDFFEKTNVIDDLLEVAVSSPADSEQLLAAVLMLISSVWPTVGGVASKFALSLLSALMKLCNNAGSKAVSISAVAAQLVALTCSTQAESEVVGPFLSNDAVTKLVRLAQKLEAELERLGSDAAEAEVTKLKEARSEVVVLLSALLSRASSHSMAFTADEDSGALVTLLGFPETTAHAAKCIVMIISNIGPEMDEHFRGSESKKGETGKDSGRPARSPYSGYGGSLSAPMGVGAKMRADEDAIPRVVLDQLLRNQLLLNRLLSVLGRPGHFENKLAVLDALSSIVNSSGMQKYPLLAQKIGLRDGSTYVAVTGAVKGLEGLGDDDFHRLVLTTLRAVDSMLRQPTSRRVMNNVMESDSAIQRIVDTLETHVERISMRVLAGFLSLGVEGGVLDLGSFAKGGSGSSSEVVRLHRPAVIHGTIRLARRCGRDMRLDMLNTFERLICASPRNRQVFADAHATRLLLDWAKAADAEERVLIGKIIGEIIEFSTSPADMRSLLSSSDDPEGGSREATSTVLQNVETAIGVSGDPAAMFDFSGRRSGLVAGTHLKHLPASRNGYSVSLWFRAESLRKVATLFAAYDDSASVEIAQVDEDVVFRSRAAHKADSAPDSVVRAERVAVLGRWIHVAVTQEAPSLMSRSRSELCLYLNSRLIASDSIRYPRFSASAASLSIGVSASAPSTSAFCGQIGAVNVFNDCLKSEVVDAIFRLGPAYDSEFLPCDPKFAATSVLVESKVHDKLVALFAPGAADEKSCPDNSPPAATGYKPVGVAKIASAEGASKVLRPRGARLSLEAAGGLRLVLMTFEALQHAVPIGTDSVARVNPVNDSLNLLVSFLRRNPLSQAMALRMNAFALGSVLAEEADAAFLDETLVDVIAAGIEKLRDNLAAVKELAQNWLLNRRLWLRGDVDVHAAILKEICKFLRFAEESDAVAAAVRECILDANIIENTTFIRKPALQEGFVDAAVQTVLPRKGRLRNAETNARDLFHLLDDLDGGPRQSMAVAFIDKFLELGAERQDTLLRILGADAAAGVMATLLSAFGVSDEMTRERAMSMACTLARRCRNESLIRRLGAMLYDALMEEPASEKLHRRLIRLVFGERGDSSPREVLEHLAPVFFHHVERDIYYSSKTAALLALAQALNVDVELVDGLSSLRMWPLWISLCGAGGTHLGARPNPTPEFIAAWRSVSAPLMRHVVDTKPLAELHLLLEIVLASPDDMFKRLAVECLCAAVVDSLTPLISQGSKSDSAKLKTEGYVDKLSAVVLAAELAVDEDVALDATRQMVDSVVEALRLARVWLEPAPVHRSGGSSSLRDRASPKSPGPRSPVVRMGLPEGVEGRGVFPMDVASLGGFLRSTLKMICWSIYMDDAEASTEDNLRLLSVAVVTPGMPLIPEFYILYIKYCTERWSGRGGPGGSPARRARAERMRKGVQEKWADAARAAGGKRAGADQPSAEAIAQDLHKAEVSWSTRSLGTLAAFSDRIQADNGTLLHGLERAAPDVKEGTARDMEQRHSFVKSRRKTLESSLNARSRSLQYEWQRVRHLDSLDRLIAERKPGEHPSEKWRLDPYQDFYGRRWLLRLEPFGPSYEAAAVSAAENASSRGETSKYQLGDETLLPMEVVERLNRAVRIIEDEEGDSDEERKDRYGAPEEVDPDADESLLVEINRHRSYRRFVSDTANMAAASASAGSILSSGPGTLVQPLSESAGTVQITTREITFRPSPTQSNSVWHGKPADVTFVEKRVLLEDVDEIHSRRYMLRNCAFEIFLRSRESLFFALPNESGCHAVLKMLDQHLKRIGSKTRMIRTSKERSLAVKDVVQLWRKKQLTNFEYLMLINKLAGRSYNDIAQYPVFPWILADYSSPTLALNDPKTFRDLSQPMGCQLGHDAAEGEVRKQYFKNRFDSWDEEVGIPKFHYGSHYSSAGIVLHFLVRLEPFTSLFLQLQGGHFDVADRMFSSVQGAWKSATTSHQNVMELIPEMFYMPMLFRNISDLPLGVTQDGRALGDVGLPPWANGSPEMFVRLHAEALESEFVTAQLPSWIDLIFGFKQKGPAAVEACNVFYYLTYEGTIDYEAMPEDLKLGVTQQIAHFGQTPVQLLKKPHPHRESGEDRSRLDRVLTATFASMDSASSHDPVIWIGQSMEVLFAVSRSRSLAVHKFLPLPDFDGNTFMFEPDLRIQGGEVVAHGKRPHGRRLGGAHFAPGFSEFALGGLFAVSGDGKVIFSGGHWDMSVRCCLTSEPARPRQLLRGHNDVVTCLALSRDDSVLVTGSRDATVRVWTVIRDLDVDRDKSRGNLDLLSELPKLILHGHLSPIKCVAVNTEVGCVASASSSGQILLHSVREGRILRNILSTSGASRLFVTNWAQIICYSSERRELTSLTVNDVVTGQVVTEGEISAIAASPVGDYCVCGNQKGDLLVHSGRDLKFLHRLELGPRVPVASLLFDTQGERVVLAGLRSGQICAATLSGQLPKRLD